MIQGQQELLVGIIVTLVFSLIIAGLGLIFFQCFWLKAEYVKLPKLNKEKKIFYPPSEDYPVSNVFSLYWQISKILFGPTRPMIERYGFEQTYYFKMRNFFILPLLISLGLLFAVTFLFGWGFELSSYEIWKRFNGWDKQNTRLSEQYVATVLIICITLPIQIACFLVARQMQNDLQEFFDYSESTEGNTKFWYHIRTSMIDYCNKEDIIGNGTQTFLDQKVESLKENEKNDLGTSKVEQVLCIPDYANLTKLEKKFFYAKAAFDEDLENC